MPEYFDKTRQTSIPKHCVDIGKAEKDPGQKMGRPEFLERAMIGSGAGHPQANLRTLLNLLLQVRQMVEACRVGTALKSVVAQRSVTTFFTERIARMHGLDDRTPA